MRPYEDKRVRDVRTKTVPSSNRRKQREKPKDLLSFRFRILYSSTGDHPRVAKREREGDARQKRNDNHEEVHRCPLSREQRDVAGYVPGSILSLYHRERWWCDGSSIPRFSRRPTFVAKELRGYSIFPEAGSAVTCVGNAEGN